MPKKSSWTSLVVFLSVVFGIQIIAGYVTSTSVSTWYAQLQKPVYNPPGWIFGPVWTLLYVLIAISGWMVERQRRFNLRDPLWQIYTIQLLLNFLWSLLFFGMHRPDLAFLGIIFLNLAILITIFMFWKVNRIPAALLIPYYLWVSFAGLLNFSIWRLNA